MKSTIKILTKTGILIMGFLVVLNSCQEESIDEQQTTTLELISNSSNEVIKTEMYYNLEELSSYVKTLKKNQVSKMSRTSIEDNNDFLIIEDKEVYIYTDSTSTTYTLAIQKNNQNIYEFSNLIVKFIDDSPTTAFILNYVPSQDYLNSYPTNNQTPFQGTINYEPLNYDGSLDGLNARRICKSITLTYCDNGGTTHAAGENCTPSDMFDITYDICYETSENDPLNESIDPPSGPNTGGGGSPNSNPTNPMPSNTCEDDITGNVGLTGSDGGCYSSEVISIEDRLNDIINEGDYTFDDSLTDYEVIGFDTVEEFEEFYYDLFDDVSYGSSETENDDGVSKRTTFNYEFDLSLFSFTLRVEVDSNLPSANSCECIEITDVNTILYGNTTLAEWEQVGNHSTQVSDNGNQLTVFTRGKLTIGIKIDGYPFKITELVTLVQVFDYSTGSVIDYYMIRE
ncbi:hypothetical protein [Psychroserpens algicola]|uniref:hypothetical protein n=1 Tax=Psychroserpens algicola TaxID=1719034 RepID=UPI001954F369|nr:hypothetical protein [Psychroserpens algicola]